MPNPYFPADYLGRVVFFEPRHIGVVTDRVSVGTPGGVDFILQDHVLGGNVPLLGSKSAQYYQTQSYEVVVIYEEAVFLDGLLHNNQACLGAPSLYFE